MTLPDYGSLTLGQLAGHLIPLAVLVALTGIGRAVTSATVLYTYLGAWVSSWLGPVLVLLAVAAVGQGIPGLIEPNALVAVLFVPAVVAWVTAALAAIAKNLGLDLASLPFARNAGTLFGAAAVGRPEVPAVSTTAGAVGAAGRTAQGLEDHGSRPRRAPRE